MTSNEQFLREHPEARPLSGADWHGNIDWSRHLPTDDLQAQHDAFQQQQSEPRGYYAIKFAADQRAKQQAREVAAAEGVAFERVWERWVQAALTETYKSDPRGQLYGTWRNIEHTARANDALPGVAAREHAAFVAARQVAADAADQAAMRLTRWHTYRADKPRYVEVDTPPDWFVV